jgi:hypothetical protein
MSQNSVILIFNCVLNRSRMRGIAGFSAVTKRYDKFRRSADDSVSTGRSHLQNRRNGLRIVLQVVVVPVEGNVTRRAVSRRARNARYGRHLAFAIFHVLRARRDRAALWRG